MPKKDTKKQKAERRLLTHQEQRQIFELGVQLGIRIAEQQQKTGIPCIRTLTLGK